MVLRKLDPARGGGRTEGAMGGIHRRRLVPLLALPAFLAPVVHGPAVAADPPLQVSIDIKPGNSANRINLDSKGYIAVALLGSAAFDALSADVATVRFGRAGAPEKDGKGQKRDVNGDGFKDLIFQFRIRETGILPGDTSARLTGFTNGGVQFEGSDMIATRGGRPYDPSVVLYFNGNDYDQDGGPGVNAGLTTASFNDAVPGAVAGVVTAASGDGSLGDFDPAVNTTLSTNSPSAVNGAFPFRRIRIRQGVTVTITGTLPATLHSLASVEIAGVLDASGAAGGLAEFNYSTALLPLAAGGAGGPGAGAGGDSYVGGDLVSTGSAGAAAARKVVKEALWLYAREERSLRSGRPVSSKG